VYQNGANVTWNPLVATDYEKIHRGLWRTRAQGLPATLRWEILKLAVIVVLLSIMVPAPGGPE